ncbi:MAG: helix-turn-helix transcriptional regulator [Comamonadaceae bacterium]|jgi:ribosome-binding protein aMBF1 (putative translation factor)|nr:helix-turn-helix transcriptional regulator [Comamonadaceae bacterium]
MIVRGVIDVKPQTCGVPRKSPSHAYSPVLVAFGLAVQARRESADLSQEALADMAEIDRSYMSSVERGVQNVGLLHASKIAGALGTSLEELMKDARI